jgi:hypothetical protein
MSPRKKTTSKTPTIEASRGHQQIEDEPNIVGAMYEDTYGLIYKERDALSVDVWTTSRRHSPRLIFNNIIIDY